MIASLRGVVQMIRLDSMVLTVGGVGLLAQATPNTLAQLQVGREAELFTSLVVREDSLTLFAFATDDERDVFEIVQSVSGIGPRTALAMLAVHTPDGLRAAVATQNLNELTKVPGIGNKGAQRMVLELSDRLGPPSTGASSAATAMSASSALPVWSDQVITALTGLGWPAKQAEQAVDAVSELYADDSTPVVAQVLRSALQHLGR